ncbi:MAG: hypothetical protein KC620_20490 [Myxococcales bacterium]|nr:hypothetical protein [Myxococcales bacterium]
MQILVWWMMWSALSAPAFAGRLAQDAPCGGDAFEPNNVRSRAKSTRNKAVEAVTCAGDDDWFYLRLDAGEAVEVSARHDAGRAVTVDVFPPRARQPAGTHEADSTRQRVRFKASTKGRYRVRISTRAAEPTPYTLEVQRPGKR